MARSHNPFAPVERSKVETPWGDFEIAPPNKARLAEIQELQAKAADLDDSTDLESIVLLSIRSAACGVENGEVLRDKLEAAWDAGEVTVLQIKSLSEFVGAEIAGEADSGND